ncbi:hypothetical protein K458DRAFT_483054 [Lentithecium fluviatile CBS 122367]|uniref:Rhodopsin domain-containing protein n=1 Tax=Lentithecium fluviatile CBS 122367 TaxID=1168545 RepID=A0A6G1JLA4_9PLEO|nr:hypothetical protein K458DRAFT_483054 [Lentithecium fluviatile CBS 122367]
MHLQNVPVSDKQRINKHPESRFILTTLSLIASVFCNLSITQLYTSMFPYRRIRMACCVLIVLTIYYGITFFVVQFFSCPRPKRLDTAMAEICMRNIRTIWVAASVVGAFIDLANILLPLPILWGLHVELGKKIRLTLLFGLVFSIVGITAVRIYLYRNMDMYDWTYHTGRIILFNGSEPALGILAGCLPIMSPCLRLASDKIKTTSKSLRGASEQRTPSEPDAQHPPTIGQGKRLSLKEIRMESRASQGFEILDGERYPLSSVAVGVLDGKEKVQTHIDVSGKEQR